MILHQPNVIRPKPIQLALGMKGYFRVQLTNRSTGRCRFDSGWFENKLLDSGMNIMATESEWLTHCHVGTDSTPPQAADTQLLGFVTSSSLIQANTYGAQASAPYYGWRRKTWRFLEGDGQGGQNLSEVGVGWGASGSTLVTRALIVDPLTQLPTTVTPQADEALDVTYELRYYPPDADVLNTVTLDSVVYNTTTRAALVNSDAWSEYIGLEIGENASAVTPWAAYDGTIGTVTQAPNGTPVNPDDTNAVVDQSYDNNSFEQKMFCPVGPTGWNVGSGIRSVVLYTTAGVYQTQFDPVIPKTSLYTIQLAWTLSWSEKT